METEHLPALGTDQFERHSVAVGDCIVLSNIGGDDGGISFWALVADCVPSAFTDVCSFASLKSWWEQPAIAVGTLIAGGCRCNGRCH